MIKMLRNTRGQKHLIFTDLNEKVTKSQVARSKSNYPVNGSYIERPDF